MSSPPIARPDYSELSPDLRYQIWKEQNKGAIARSRLSKVVKAIASKAYWIALTPLILYVTVKPVNDFVNSAVFIKSIWDLNPLGRTGKIELSELDEEQKRVASEIIAAGKEMGVSERDIKIALMTSQQESGMRDSLMSAIVEQESNSDYKIVNSDSGAIGLGQVMPENVATWTKEALGKSLTPEEFRLNKSAQVETLKFKLDQYYKQAIKESGGNQDEAVRRVASMWYSGRSNLYNDTTSQFYGAGSYPSIDAYTRSVLAKVGAFKQHGAWGDFACRKNTKCSAKLFFAALLKDVERNSKAEWEVAASLQNTEDTFAQLFQQWDGLSDRILNSAKQSVEEGVFPIPGQTWESAQKTSGYGDRVHPVTGKHSFHWGLDLAVPQGTPIVATASGKVVESAIKDDACGGRVAIALDDGSGIRFCHMLEVSVPVGQQVDSGDEIGKSGGDPGTKGSGASTGAHLHFERMEGGKTIDPTPYLKSLEKK
jgi:hypothetical protein